MAALFKPSVESRNVAISCELLLGMKPCANMTRFPVHGSNKRFPIITNGITHLLGLLHELSKTHLEVQSSAASHFRIARDRPKSPA